MKTSLMKTMAFLIFCFLFFASAEAEIIRLSTPTEKVNNQSPLLSIVNGVPQVLWTACYPDPTYFIK